MKLLTVVSLLLLLFFIEYINSNEYINVILQKCLATGSINYCNVTNRCRPLNRTSKMTSMEFRFRPGLKLEAPIDIEVIAYKKYRTVYRQTMLKLKTELCAQLNRAEHPFFKKVFQPKREGNMLDPCPISGRRYFEPYVSTHEYVPLMPVGEWRVDFILWKNINDSDEFIGSWSDFYEIKPTSALEF